MDNREKLLQKLFMEACTREELELLFHILREDPSAAAPEVMTELFRQLGPVPEMEEDTSNRIFARIAAETWTDEPAIRPQVKKSASRRLRMWLSSAAAVLLFLVGAWLFQYLQPDEMMLEQTAFNEIKEFILPDSSNVVLNGNSSLRYSAGWTEGETRIVYLEGEAYFQIRKKPETDAKFQVVTSDLTVEVLGTAFNVSTRRAETSVFLEEGKVKVSLEDAEIREVYLEPGQVMSYSVSDKKLDLPTQVAAGLQTSWRTGVLEFKEEPLRLILEKLAAAHHLKFEIQAEELANRTFTLKLPTEDMDVTMAILSKAAGMSIAKNESTFVIRPKGEQEKKE